jgi:hypothetical protein
LRWGNNVLRHKSNPSISGGIIQAIARPMCGTAKVR